MIEEMLATTKENSGHDKATKRPIKEKYNYKKKKKQEEAVSNSKSRRFSDEQIKSLESVFKMENKLEPRKRLEMATQLGLHPRQVSIWFQNRRARWKSKQVEQDYTTLKADYDNLTHRFHSLNKEKHHLLQQLSNLCSQLKEAPATNNYVDSGSENYEINYCSSRGGFSGGQEDEEIPNVTPPPPHP